MSKIIWTIKELAIHLRKRQLNEFDVNIGVSGRRGNGKSSFLFKLLNSFKKEGFNQEKHQVYNRETIIDLLCDQKFSFCWDDEAINSGYKRDFQKTGQKDLIKIVTNYRDNYNIYCSALPFFYSLDVALRELIFCHIHIIERGLGVILMPIADQIHGADPWDTKNNIKIEVTEQKRIKNNPDATFRYEKLTTFAGYIYFGKMTKKQEKKYKEIKSRKRNKEFRGKDKEEKLNFVDKIITLLLDNKITKDGLIQSCLSQEKLYSTVIKDVNRKLKDMGEIRTLKNLFRTEIIKSQSKDSHNNVKNIVPLLEP